MKCTEPFPMKTTHDSIEQTTTRCCTKKARKDDRITLAKYYVDEIYGDKMGVACNTPKRGEKCTQKISWKRSFGRPNCRWYRNSETALE
jgi:hypothetical protein